MLENFPKTGHAPARAGGYAELQNAQDGFF
jgi:hypothetical protein